MATTKVRKKSEELKNAAAYLADVQPEKSFWVNNGWIIRNLKELPLALRKMSNETFVYHVNKTKNDFAKWVEEVIGDKKLASEIKNAFTKAEMIAAVEKRLEQLKKAL